MKTSPGPHKTPSKLSESVHQQLNMYALAAGAAGVGLLALAQPAEAEIVYTPTHVTLKPGTSYLLDLDNDGTAEILLLDTASGPFGPGLFAGRGGSWSSLGGRVEVQLGIFGALALNRGAQIGGSKSFCNCVSETGSSLGEVLASVSSRDNGQWVNVTDRYLGIKFLVSGVTYYGWARLSVRVNGKTVAGVLTGYAYENIPNHSIRAGQTSGTSDDVEASPESSSPATQRRAPSAEKPISQGLQPATPGVLALGAQGVPLWRREESALEGD